MLFFVLLYIGSKQKQILGELNGKRYGKRHATNS